LLKVDDSGHAKNALPEAEHSGWFPPFILLLRKFLVHKKVLQGSGSPLCQPVLVTSCRDTIEQSGDDGGITG
jgi:hypothetical protein